MIRTQSMLRNVGSNWVMTVGTIAVTYVTTPFVIRTLGSDGYGTWTLITAMTGYLGLLALGVPMACVRYSAQYLAEGDQRKTNQTIGSCAGLYLIVGICALFVGGVLLVLFSIYNIPSALRHEARMAFGVMVIWVSASFIGFLPEGIMFAHHDFVLRNVVRLAGVLVRMGLTIGLLSLDPSVLVLALVQLLCFAFDFGVSICLIRRRYQGVRIRLTDYEWATVRRIFSFSMYVLLLSAGVRLSFETDALVVGAFLGVGAISYYAVANSLTVYLMEFIIAIAAVVAPMATKLQTEGRPEELRAMFLKWSKVALSLSIMACLFLIVLGPTFISWWIGPEFERPSGEVLQILALSCLAFLPVRGVALPILMGIGKPRTPTLAFVGAGVMNLVLSILLARPFGLAGVALGTAIPNVVFAGIVTFVACRELGISVGSYLQYVVPRAALGAVPVLALLLWFKLGMHVEDITGLITAGVAVVCLFAVTWVFFVYKHDPYVDLTPHLSRLRSWSGA